MKTNELAKWCLEHPDVDVFIANMQLDENGDIDDISFHELELEAWDDTDPTSHFIINPGEMVSG